jgi:hypothetical protein
VLTIWGQKVPVGLRADTTTTTTTTNTWSPSDNFLTKTLGPDKLSICHYPLPTTNPDLPCCPPRDFPPFPPPAGLAQPPLCSVRDSLALFPLSLSLLSVSQDHNDASSPSNTPTDKSCPWCDQIPSSVRCPRRPSLPQPDARLSEMSWQECACRGGPSHLNSC